MQVERLKLVSEIAELERDWRVLSFAIQSWNKPVNSDSLNHDVCVKLIGNLSATNQQLEKKRSSLTKLVHLFDKTKQDYAQEINDRLRSINQDIERLTTDSKACSKEHDKVKKKVDVLLQKIESEKRIDLMEEFTIGRNRLVELQLRLLMINANFIPKEKEKKVLQDDMNFLGEMQIIQKVDREVFNEIYSHCSSIEACNAKYSKYSHKLILKIIPKDRKITYQYKAYVGPDFGNSLYMFVTPGDSLQNPNQLEFTVDRSLFQKQKTFTIYVKIKDIWVSHMMVDI